MTQGTVDAPYVLVTGSRKWTDKFLIHNTLTSFHWMYAGSPVVRLLHGGAKGADQMCEDVAMHLGWRVLEFPANWKVEGKSAGIRRNKLMVDVVAAQDGPKICLAFILDDSKGATHCADAAEKAGIETLRFKRYSIGVSNDHPVETGPPGEGDPDILRGVEAISGDGGVSEGPGDHR